MTTPPPAPAVPRITSITVSCSPVVRTDKYNAYKPHASVTVRVEVDPADPAAVDAAVRAAVPALRAAAFHALACEVNVANDAYLGADVTDVDALLALCKKETDNAASAPHVAVEGPGPATPAAKAGGPGPGKVPAKSPVKVPAKVPPKVAPKAGPKVAPPSPQPASRPSLLFGGAGKADFDDADIPF